MLRVTLRDLQHRRRQFAIAVFGAGVVFGLALLLSGVSQGFQTEVQDTVHAMKADGWVLTKGVESPFSSAVPAAAAPIIARGAGAKSGRPVVLTQDGALMPDGSRQNVTVIGLSGSAPPGRAVADDHVNAKPGQTVYVGGRPIVIDRHISDATLWGGTPLLYVDLATAQMLRFGNTRTASAILLSGNNLRPPGPRFNLRTNRQIQKAMMLPMKGAVQTVNTFRALMWLVAGIIIGAITYLSALERVRDFAVMKAVGGDSRQLAISVMLGAVIASLLAAIVAAGVAYALTPVFPMPVDFLPMHFVMLPIVAVIVGILASIAALRRVVKIDPALAFG